MAARDGDTKEAATGLSRKLQQLRSVTHSSAVTEESILMDASRYIRELKDRVEKLKENVDNSHEWSHQGPLVEVKALEKGFRVKIYSENTNRNLLVSVLDAFDQLGLEVVDARVSSTTSFLLEAIIVNEGGSGSVDDQAIKQPIVEAIRKWKQQRD